MPALLGVLLLLAPADNKQWSEKHGIGAWIPKEWTILERDQGSKVLIVKGPRLGPGTPRMVLWNAGPAAGPLGEITKELAKKVAQRNGWQVTANVKKSIGPWPCRRIGIRFVENGTKGRARFTVVLMGGSYYVLELLAAASHFPAATFDRIEKSLEVRWSETTLDGGLRVSTPRGWSVKKGAGSVRLDWPSVWGVTAFLEAQPNGLSKPPTAKPGAKLAFLGGRRATFVEERVMGGKAIRLLLVHAEGWTGAVMIPVAKWDHAFPAVAEILKRAKLPGKPK